MKDLPDVALSIRQPWAWAILNAGKRIENRTWATKRRGPICLHAALGCPRADYAFASEYIMRVSGSIAPDDLLLTERGGVIGTAEIVDCIEASDDPWFMGPYGFVLENVQPVEFIPVSGALNFFDWRKNRSLI